ncbi:Uncharacterised protein [Klebsiella pneumoniae]|uniref:Uncharacterized protein n=1 Tax=Klebsiella pneumoniae TaxID=573 RepID=A0A2X3CHV4_KLEPN|nr:Uncharacterised protein [Klebsiella pneumoniae]HDU1553612.1 hypothetical protein [Klebsiella pneumoniae]
MTNNQLTKEWLQQTIAELESVRDEIPFGIDTNSELELAAFKMALAAMDGEPVAVVEPSDYVTAAQLVGEGPVRKAVHELYEGALRIGDKLYRHAQPAPELAAIVERLNLSGYEYEGGEVTPQNAAAIVDTLLQQLDDEVQGRNAQPAPVVPEDVLDALQKVARIRLDLNGFDGDRRGIADCLGNAEEALIEVVNRRAAMLAAAPQEAK